MAGWALKPARIPPGRRPDAVSEGSDKYETDRDRVPVRVDEPPSCHATGAAEDLEVGTLPLGQAEAPLDLLGRHRQDLLHPEGVVGWVGGAGAPGLLGEERVHAIAGDHRR